MLPDSNPVIPRNPLHRSSAMTKKWSSTKSGDGLTKQAASKAARREFTAKVESWWCQPCSQEVYTLRCKYCGKSESEES